MNDIITTAALLDAAEANLRTAKDAAAEARDAVVGALAELIMVARESDRQDIADAANAVIFCQAEIATKSEHPDNGLRALETIRKEAAGAMRTAAKQGNAQAEEAILGQAEADLDELKAELRDLKRSEKQAVKTLRGLISGIV